ncbi:MAG: tetratricopeptide repeat protein [Planctomycetes bacterium]|nr:tetratricopeptide repeat protein [Planctomycetota bacterium]
MSAAPQRKDQVRSIFARARELPPADRPAFLRTECGSDDVLREELASLLDLHEEARQLLPEPAPAAERPGDRIGRYKLLQQIGEGGFGTVWMAEQEEPVLRKVALKVLKAGMDTAQVVGRFEAERQALAMMDHPNIAKVFDGGATPQGRPYFVMELVKGIPITRYCDDAGLGMRERLELFVPVCQAVQHAHQKGVIHRDLKPGNVLVTLHDGRPVPKVIDFGIAKATQGRLTDRTVFTGFQQMLGTPEYMAPEQAELSGLDVDTRADIYSLGVLLYELLTGTRPFELKTLLEAGYAEMVRTIKEVDPPKPSTRISTLGDQLLDVARHRKVHPRALGTLMRGDLDWIVMKALEKERGRRYDTATALADDVLRHLAHEPVLASRASRLYRWRKYVRRHRVGVAAGAAIVLALLAGGIAATFGYVEARAAEDKAEGERAAAVLARLEEQRQREVAEAALVQAEAQRRRAENEVASKTAVVGLLTDLFWSSDPHENRGPGFTVRQMLDEFAALQLVQLEGQPEVEWELRLVVAHAYLGLGLPDEALPNSARSVTLARERLPERPDALANALWLQSWASHDMRRWHEALQLLEEAKELLRDLEGQDDLRAVISHAECDNLYHLGSLDEAKARESLSLVEQAFGSDGHHTNLARELLAKQLSRQNSFEEAAAVLRVAVEHRPADARERVNRALYLLDLARAIGHSGRTDEGIRLSEEALSEYEAVLGRHPKLIDCLNTLSELCRMADRHEDAVAYQRRALELRAELYGPEDPGCMLRLIPLGHALIKTKSGRAEAEACFRRALELASRPDVNDREAIFEALHGLVSALILQGPTRHEEALGVATRAVELSRRRWDGDSAALADALADLAKVNYMLKRYLAAEDPLREAVAIWRRLEARAVDHVPPSPHAYSIIDRHEQETNPAPKLITSLTWLGLALAEQGPEKRRETIEVLQQAFDRWAELGTGPGSRNLCLVLSALGRARLDAGEIDAAIPTLQQAVAAWREDVQSWPDEAGAWTAFSLKLRPAGVRLIRALLDRGRCAEAEEAAREVLRLTGHLRSTKVAGFWQFAELTMLRYALARQGKTDEAAAADRRLEEMRAAPIAPFVLLASAQDLLRWGEVDRAVSVVEQALGALELDSTDLSYFLPISVELSNRGRPALAEKLLRRLLTSQQGPGKDRADAALTRGWLIFALRKQGKLAEAEELGRQHLALAREAHGADSAEAATSLAQLVQVLLAQGKAVDAELAATESLALRAAKQPGTWQHYAAMALLGRALLAQGRLAEAEPLLAESCAKMQPPPASVEHLTAALEAMIDLCVQQGRPEAAAPWREKLATLASDAAGPRDSDR